MASIPENPKDQFLFLIDNPIVAGEPGGLALIKGFLELVIPLVSGHSVASSAMAAMFDDDLFATAAPIEGAPAGDSGGHGGGHGDDAGAALELALGLLGGFAKGGELDL